MDSSCSDWSSSLEGCCSLPETPVVAVAVMASDMLVGQPERAYADRLPDFPEQANPKKMNSWGKAALSCSAVSLILHVASFIVPAAVGKAGGVRLAIPLCLGACVFVMAAVNAFREDDGKALGHLPLWAGC
jgi:hypothetical protein